MSGVPTTVHLTAAERSVSDVMTPSPVSVGPNTPIGEVVRALMDADFQGVPVVDEAGHPLGMITQTDLLARGGVPLHVGLLSDLPPVVDRRLDRLGSVAAAEMMTPDPVTVRGDEALGTAVEAMLHRNLKRLPVVDGDGILIGMLCRADIFRSISRSGVGSQTADRPSDADRRAGRRSRG